MDSWEDVFSFVMLCIGALFILCLLKAPDIEEIIVGWLISSVWSAKKYTKRHVNRAAGILQLPLAIKIGGESKEEERIFRDWCDHVNKLVSDCGVGPDTVGLLLGVVGYHCSRYWPMMTAYINGTEGEKRERILRGLERARRVCNGPPLSAVLVPA